MLCEWAYGVAMSFFWVVVIDAQDKNHLMKSVLEVGNIEPETKGKWKVSDRELNALFNEQTQDTIGCIFADSVRVPGETVSVEGVGGGRGGHLKGKSMGMRAELGDLELGFRETNLSFTDFLLRPWNIVSGYKGLIADDGGLSSPSNANYWGGSIKSNIHLYQLAKDGNGYGDCAPSVVRKEFHFFDAVPTSISSDDLVSDGGSGINKRQVTFTYNYYTVGSGNA
jgi:hypothetical protein|tara:strand:- start:2351 stop:3025 length:675 start_codon:yes stop_codon:yes gene_type:complete